MVKVAWFQDQLHVWARKTMALNNKARNGRSW